MVPLHEINPRPGNPRKHPERQLSMYVEILRSHGWRRPIVVSENSGFIVAGEGAWLAAKRAGLLEAPVEIQKFETESDELSALLADNRLFELGSTNKDLLAEILRQVGDSTVTGYGPDELAKLLKEVAQDPQYPITARLNERHDYVLIFTDSETDFQFLKNLCGVQTERSFKNTTIGEGRAVPFARFLEALRENLHSIAQTRGVDDDAPAA